MFQFVGLFVSLTVYVYENIYTDDTAANTRTWPRCIFQSIRDDPIDQFVFQLFGGRLVNWEQDFLSGGCDMWMNPKKHHNCPCTAPLNLLNSGTFVEIGANDGLHMSNTWFFEHHLGWRGMCVEANPHVFRRLKTNRPACTNVNAIVSTESDTKGEDVPFISFYRKDGQEKAQTYRDWETGLSGAEGTSVQSNHEISSLARAQKFADRNAGVFVERNMLPRQSFAQLFAKHNFTTIDLLSIDVEGHEYAVLSSIDFRRVHIRVIVTETVTKQVSKLLERNDFRDLGIIFRLGDHVFVNNARRRE